MMLSIVERKSTTTNTLLFHHHRLSRCCNCYAYTAVVLVAIPTREGKWKTPKCHTWIAEINDDGGTKIIFDHVSDVFVVCCY